MNEYILVRKIYTFLEQRSSVEIPTHFHKIAKVSGLTIDEIKHFINLIQYKYNLSLRFVSRKTDAKNIRTICLFCRKEYGIFRPMGTEIEITAEGTKIPGEFVCDECYNEIKKK